MTYFLLGCFTILVVLFFVGWHAAKKEKMAKVQESKWLQLPTGWAKGYGGMDAFIMRDQTHFYWFINRGGRTIIEGPAATFDLAMNEVEAALSDFGRR